MAPRPTLMPTIPMTAPLMTKPLTAMTPLRPILLATALLSAVAAATLHNPARAQSAAADSASLKGRQIAQEAWSRERGFQNYRVTMEMVLSDKRGQSSTRHLRAAVAETPSDGFRSLMMFNSPADIRGTAFLNHAHPTRLDDQWLYLPSIKRTKRIATESRAGSFMSSEFAFEDMTTQELEKYSYRYLGADKVIDRAAHKVERVPLYEGSGYTRQVVWFDEERHVALQADYYDRRNERLKTLTLGNYKLFAGKFWKPETMTMVNHLNGKSTVIKFTGYEFGTSLAEAEMDPQRLEYVR